MTTILALTVGGSCAPVVTAIHDYRPDLVCFLATKGEQGSRSTVDGPGKPCGRQADQQPSIIAQLGLSPEQYDVVELADPDDLGSIYAVCRATLCDLAAQHPQARLIADYTGGSKSMGVGLALAALEGGWQLSLVKGMRTDLVRVVNGTEMAGQVNAWEVRVRQRMEEARRLFNCYAYTSAAELLERLAREGPLPCPLDLTVRTWVTYCRGLDAWDRFDHQRAVELLKAAPGAGIPWRFLKALAGKANASGYEPVLDLIRNAERRAVRGRYDDAVARLYRAIEMLAQKRLAQREPPLDSSDLDLESLPEPVRRKYLLKREFSEGQGRGSSVRLGLTEDYELLRELGDPLGEVYGALEKRLQNALTKRNHSIMAHGTTPLSRSDYEAMWTVIQSLLKVGSAALGISLDAPQFPVLKDDALAPRGQG